MKYYLKEISDVEKALETDTVRGLTVAEAEQRARKDGKNSIRQNRKTSLFSRLLTQLSDPMVLVLIGAAAVSAVTSYIGHESFADVFVILTVVILNTFLGIIQESKAENAIEQLMEMSAATSKVIRDGDVQTVKSEDIVVGDIVLLEAGDAVPADGRLIESFSLQVEEAALTGESTAVEKNTAPHRQPGAGEDEIPLGDRRNMAYMGSTAIYGRGKMIITATGMNTEMGQIAKAITEAGQNETPLQKKLRGLSRSLSALVLFICAFMFIFTLLKEGKFDGKTVLDTFMLSVSLAVAAIPEGLAAVVTIVLSMGVTKMSAGHAIIRRLTAVETLGCTQIICTDKTGTLTQNKMTVVKVWGSDRAKLTAAMALCTDAEFDREGHPVGEPTECALIEYARSVGFSKTELSKKEPRIGELPFDSTRKMMSTLHRAGHHEIRQYTKGAPDELLSHCQTLMLGGRAVPLTEERRAEIEAQNRLFAAEALRVLGCAVRILPAERFGGTPSVSEDSMTFLGLVGMMDPVRPEVAKAILDCRTAGIRPIMITGDHKDTAVAIAKSLEIIKDEREAVTGADIEKMSDADFFNRFSDFSVYARVKPTQKAKIVSAWQSRGMVTAMTGDGVNDAPSIKSADIGIGMGITGTDVTKNVADMILADDNFATIVNAVAEGRRIYDNIGKCIGFLLSSNLSEVISIFLATVMGFKIFGAPHILFINLVTDSLPALALGAEPPERDIMKRHPRKNGESILSGGMGFSVCYQGIMLALITLASYFIGHYMESGVFEMVNSQDGTTMAFLTMSMAEIFHAYNLRTRRSLFSLRGHNMLLFATTVLSLLLTSSVIFIPALNSLFSLKTINLSEYLTALLLALLTIPIVEIVKCLTKKKDGR